MNPLNSLSMKSRKKKIYDSSARSRISFFALSLSLFSYDWLHIFSLKIPTHLRYLLQPVIHPIHHHHKYNRECWELSELFPFRFFQFCYYQTWKMLDEALKNEFLHIFSFHSTLTLTLNLFIIRCFLFIADAFKKKKKKIIKIFFTLKFQTFYY